MCGQHYAIDHIELFFNSLIVDLEVTPLEMGMRLWSVVDVIVEENLCDDDSDTPVYDSRCIDYSNVEDISPSVFFAHDSFQYLVCTKLLLSDHFTGS